MSTQLDQIAKKAKSNPKLRFTSLAHLLTPEFLTETWKQMNRRGTSGVDGETTKEFEQDLDTQAEAVGFAWLDPHLRSLWPKYIGASCKVDLCGQLARIFLTVASSVPTWTTFLQSLPQMRRRPCSSHCLRRRSPPVFRRCALWTERRLHLSVGPHQEQKPFHPTPIHDSFENRPARGRMLSLCVRESVVHTNE